MQIESLVHVFTDQTAKLLFRRTKQAVYASWGWGATYDEYVSHCKLVGAPIISQSSYGEQIYLLNKELEDFTVLNNKFITK